MGTLTVTVLFTDLVGSTELSQRLGPNATEALRQTHFGLLRGAIQSAGGTEVKNLGDGVMVAFTSLSRALACAVAMQQAIERHNHRDAQAPLSVRIGLSTGEATEDDGDYFGDPVVEAARLCAAAQGGQILATEVVKLMAGRHATQEFVPVGDLELKGIAVPVPCVEVVWEVDAAPDEPGGQLPLPSRLVSASAESLFAFFGRADELIRLADTYKASAAERRLRVTLVSGEPGIGKTTLVAQSARAAHAAGAYVLYGNCEEGLGVPYQPWITALAQLVEHADESTLRAFVDANGIALARLVPALALRLSVPVPDASPDADSERFLILEGVARLLALASVTAPLVLVLDDLHWVDAASLQLLRHLIASATPMAVMVVGTFRESDLSRGHPLTGTLADLRREACVERLDVVGLDDIEIIELLGAAAGHEMADDGIALAHALRRETAGNPFFLVEVIRHLAETGAFEQDATGRWILSSGLDGLGLPSSVREVVAHRVARLGPAVERALTSAAVIGREFDLDVLAMLLETDESQLLDALEQAAAAGLVTESNEDFGRYRFVHALIQHTLYQELSTTRRQLAHRKVADALEVKAGTGTEPIAELARHWLAATRPSDTAKALHYARRAGDAALAAYAPLDAVNWYSQAFELQSRQPDGDERERCAILIGLGRAQAQAGQPQHRETQREAGRIALRLADRDLLVGCALARSPGVEAVSEVDADRLDVIDAALAAVGPADSSDRARLLACLAEEIDPREAARRSETASEAIDVARRIGDDATLLSVLTLALTPLNTPDTLASRLDGSKVALELADRLGDVASRNQALFYRSWAAAETGDFAEFDGCLAEIETTSARTGIPMHRFVMHMYRAWRRLSVGRVTEAAVDSDAMLEIGTSSGFSFATGTYGAQLLQRHLMLGRLDEIVDAAEKGFAENPTIPAWRAAIMNLYNELGRYVDAAALFDIGFAADFDDLPFNESWLQAICQYADCAADMSRTDAAPLIYRLLEPYADRFAFLSSADAGAVARPLGRVATLLGRYDDAATHLQHALTMHERLEAPYWIARTQIDLAELAVASRGPAGAGVTHDLLDAARSTADTYGFSGLLPHIDRLGV